MIAKNDIKNDIFYKIDKKDRKILVELDKNSRVNLSQLAKICNLPKHVVRYRVANLQQSGIIKKFYSIIDLTCLGYINYRIYWKFMDNPPAVMNEILSHLAAEESLWWVARVSSKYDLVCAGWAKSIEEIHSLTHNFKKKFRKNIKCENIAFYTYLKHFPKRYLDPKSEKQALVPYIGRNKLVEIDNFDMQLLKLLSENARERISKISITMGLAETAVRERIKKLEQKGILAGYKVLLDYEKLGMLYFWVHCELKNYDNIDKIEKAIEENSNVVYIDRTVGGSDIEFGVQYTNPRQLEEYIEKLKVLFADDIREIEYLTVFQNIKVKYFPETILHS